MGIVNTTPDSFSDGGLWTQIKTAVAHGLSLIEAGADVLDIGGESTRPFSDPVDAEEHQQLSLLGRCFLKERAAPAHDFVFADEERGSSSSSGIFWPEKERAGVRPGVGRSILKA